MEGNASFGYWVRRQRKALDLTQAELARRLGCAPSTIRMIEADARRPSRQIAVLLAEQLAIAPADRDAFIRAARAELNTDRLAPPVQHVSRAPNLTALDLPSGIVTFVLTDIAGSTALWEHYPQAMPAALARHTAILREAIATHGGVVFKTVGDAIFAACPSASAALAAALAAQRALQAEVWGATGPLRVRMALHTGSVEARDGEYLGLSLSRVARLLSASHGGQVLLSLATKELVREHLPPEVTLRSLGEHRLKDLSSPEQIYQLVTPDLPTKFPPLLTLDRHRTNLPAQPTPLIGREHEVGATATLLRATYVRLLTLTGPGGVGKTRLALQVAAELIEDFVDGVAFVDLAPIRDTSLVTTVITAALGLQESSGQPLLERLKDYLRDKRILLLLDNFEHLLDAAGIVATLLAAAPHLKVLATSRERLHLRGEHEVAVPPLALPSHSKKESSGMQAEAARKHDTDRGSFLPSSFVSHPVTQYAAVALFIQRAQASQPTFQVTNATAPAVVEICVQLDGLPLAIELAAARLKLFPPNALLTRLSSRLALLTGGPRDLPARQQTMRNAIAWSYDLLNNAEQILFRRFGVFVGGCSLEAVGAICTLVGDPPLDVLEALAALVDQSLLRQLEGPEGTPRFVMFETIREYALEQLALSGQESALRQRHGAYYLGLAESAEPHLHGAQQLRWLNRLELDHDNFRAALAWSQATADSHSTGSTEAAEIGLRMASALAWFWFARGHWSEGRAWVEGALARGDVAPALIRATTLNWLGEMERWPGYHVAARVHYQASLAIGRAAQDKRTIATALRGVGMCALWQQLRDFGSIESLLEQSKVQFQELQDTWNVGLCFHCLGQLALQQRAYKRAEVLYEESLALFRRLQDSWQITFSLLSVGRIVRYQGEYARAKPFLEECVALAQHHHARTIRADGLMHLGNVERYQGNYERAAACYDECLALARDLGDQELIAAVLPDLGYLAHQQGDQARAIVLLRESLVCCRELDYQGVSAWSFAGLSRIAVAQGQLERAAQLIGATAALFAIFNPAMDPTDQADYERAVAVARAQLDAATFDAAWATGRAMTVEQAITYAMDADSPGDAVPSSAQAAT